MSIKKTESGWLVDEEPAKGYRHRKTFKTKAEALRFQAHIRTEYATASNPWSVKKDARRLNDLLEQWYNLHGINLRDGLRRYRSLCEISTFLKNPVSSTLSAEDFCGYRSHRLSSGLSSKTLNNHLGYMKAVFNELKILGHISFDNPLFGVKPIKIQERELSFLTNDQVTALIDAIKNGTDNPHVELITLVCLSTGCRWSEAENLTLSSVRNGQVTFSGTKSGRVRSVPIAPALQQRLEDHLIQFKKMTSSLGSFRRALARSGIKLPEGQASHVLRHTYASHFVMGGGDIVALKAILGHSTINMTMRYSHLAPDHLKQSLKLSPVRHLFDT